MQTIRKLLEPFIQAHRLEPGLLSLRLQARWSELVGPQIAAHSHPAEIRRDILMIVVDSPVWSQELSLLKEELIRRVNSLKERPILRQIRFRLGEIPLPEQTDKPDLPAKPSGPMKFPWAEELVEGISDPDLKTRIQKILRLALGR